MKSEKQLNDEFSFIGDVAYHCDKDVTIDFTTDKTKIYASQELFATLGSGDNSFRAWVESAIEQASPRFHVHNGLCVR